MPNVAAMPNMLTGGMPAGPGVPGPEDAGGPIAPAGPQAPAGPSAPAAPASPPDLMAQYRKLQSAEHMLGVVRTGLDSLMALGDTVTTEDVVQVAGRLVAEGLDPTQVAGLLADMPEKGELLVDWISQHDQSVAGRQQQLDMVTTAVRHELGVQAMHGLMLHHLDNISGGAISGENLNA